MKQIVRYDEEPADKAAFTAHFDQFYTRFAAVYDLAVRVLPVWKGWLRHALPHIRGPRVLEVSFGTGYLLTQYAGRFETYGIDYNPRMVAMARKNLAQYGLQATLQQGNVAALPSTEFALSPSRSFLPCDTSWAPSQCLPLYGRSNSSHS